MLPTAGLADDIWVLPLLAILIVALAFFGAGLRDRTKRRARGLQRLTEGGTPIAIKPDAQREQPPHCDPR